jgi:hypothetical protein
LKEKDRSEEDDTYDLYDDINNSEKKLPMPTQETAYDDVSQLCKDAASLKTSTPTWPSLPTPPYRNQLQTNVPSVYSSSGNGNIAQVSSSSLSASSNDNSQDQHVHVDIGAVGNGPEECSWYSVSPCYDSQQQMDNNPTECSYYSLPSLNDQPNVESPPMSESRDIVGINGASHSQSENRRTRLPVPLPRSKRKS